MLLLDVMARDEQFISTFSGRQLSLLAPDATQIDIEDIAHGLAYQCCCNGQTRNFYSLAQHCMLVAQLVPPQHRLAALLHDGAAAYLGDVTCSLRQLLPESGLIEKRIMAAVGEKFSINDFSAAPIRRAHLVALATEQRDLMRDAGGANPSRESAAPIPRRIEAVSPEEARHQFGEMFAELTRKVPAQKNLVAFGQSGREWQSSRQLAG